MKQKTAQREKQLIRQRISLTLFILHACILSFICVLADSTDSSISDTPLESTAVADAPSVTYPKRLFIVIHGTWAHWKSSEGWFLPDGDFFKALEIASKDLDARVIPCCWSGGLSDFDRREGAKVLQRLIELLPPSVEIILITHSHGTNVAIIASQELAKNHSNRGRIKIVYALGTPVDTDAYAPNMDVIGHFYNLFSFNDPIQARLGYERVYFPHERIANLAITIEGMPPTHGLMHAPTIARWLPTLHEYLHLQTIENDTPFCCLAPCTVHFSDQSAPSITLDSQRKQSLEQDKKRSRWSILKETLFHRSPKVECRESTSRITRNKLRSAMQASPGPAFEQ